MSRSCAGDSRQEQEASPDKGVEPETESEAESLDLPHEEIGQQADVEDRPKENVY